MSSTNVSFTSRFIADQQRANSTLSRTVAGNSETRKTAADLSIGDVNKLNSATAKSSTLAGYQANVSETGKGRYLASAQATGTQILSLAREVRDIATQAGSLSEDATSRIGLQASIDALLIRINALVASSGIVDGSVSSVKSTAAADIEIVRADANCGAATTAAEANTAIQTALTATLTIADRQALNSIQTQVAAGSNTAVEFYTKAFSVLSRVGVDAQLYNLMADDAMRVQKIAPLLFAVLGAAVAADPSGSGATAASTVNNQKARLVAALTGQAVPATVGVATQTGSVAPSTGALLPLSQQISALFTAEEKAALQNWVQSTAGNAVAAGAGAAAPAEALAVIANITCFNNLFTNLPANNLGAVNAAGIFAAGGAIAALPDAAMVLINQIAIRTAAAAGAAATAVNIVYGSNATNVLNPMIPNMSLPNIGLAGLNVRDATGAAGAGAAERANKAVGLLSAAIASLNAQSGIYDLTLDALGDAKDIADGTADGITKPDSATTGALLASIRRLNGMLMTLLVLENIVLTKQSASAEQVATGG